MQIVNIISIQHFGCFTIILTRTGFYVNYESFADRMGNCSVIWACYHYCDSVGFKELPDFQKENYLKAAEMSTEDDYGMIDGINPEESVIPKKSGKRRRRDEFCL